MKNKTHNYMTINIKNVLFLLFLAISFTSSVWSQHQYKVEYDIAVNGGDYYIKVDNDDVPGSILNDDSVRILNSRSGMIENNRDTRNGGFLYGRVPWYKGDFVVKYPFRISKVVHSLFCIDGDQFDREDDFEGNFYATGYGSADEFFECSVGSNPSYIRIFELLDLDVINPFITNGVTACNGLNSSISFNTDGGYDDLSSKNSISVRYQGITKEIYSYGRRAGSPTIYLRDMPSNYEVGKEFTIIVRYNDGDINPPVTRTVGTKFKLCSPKQDGPVKVSGNTCFGTNNGSVTLKFKNNVTGSGNRIRFFIYEGDRANFPNEKLEDAEQPENITGITALADPILDMNPTTLEASYNQLPEGDFFIVYQEIGYDPDGEVEVYSGELTENFSILGPSEITTTVSNINQPVCKEDKGTVTLSASGGDFNRIYEYRIETIGNWQTSPTFTNLNQGTTYTFLTRKRTVDNSVICNASDSNKISVAINEITDPITSGEISIVRNPDSPTATNGELSVSSSGGTLPLIYELINTGNNQVIRTIGNSFDRIVSFTGLSEGNYKVRITDSSSATGCTDESFEQQLEGLKVPAITTDTFENIICFNGSGRVLLLIKDAVSYQWYKDNTLARSGPIAQNEITLPFEDLKEGTYQLEVIPQGGSFGNRNTVHTSEKFEIVDPPQVTLSIDQVNDISCYGESDGTIKVSVTGGTSYSYTLDEGQNWAPLTNNEIPISTENTYDIQVRNEKDCVSNIETGVFVAEPKELSILVETKRNVNTFGGNDGLLDISVLRNDLNTTETFTYIWRKNGTFVTNNEDLTTNITAGTYQLEVRDANATPPYDNSCVLIQEFTIYQPNKIVEDVIPATCNGKPNGSISLEINEGQSIPGIAFSWTDSEGNPVGTTNPINGLTADSYTVRITGLPFDPEGGQTFEERTYSFIDPDPIDVNETIEEVTTFGGNDGSITMTVVGGTNPYTYSWTGPNGYTSTRKDIDNLTAGEYFLEIRDANASIDTDGCIFTTRFVVPEPTKIEESIQNASCNGNNDGSITLIVNEGQNDATLTFNWRNSDTNESVGTGNPITGLYEGSYTVTIGGLPFGVTKEFPFYVGEPDPLMIEINTQQNVSSFGGNDGAISISVTGGTPPYTYSWTSDAGGFTSTDEDIENLLSGTYTIEVVDANGTTRTANGCSTGQSIFIGQPDIIEETIVKPTCRGGNDGSISVLVNKGIGTFTYLWDTGQTTSVINNLPRGFYTVIIEGLPNGTQERTYFVDNPFSLEVDDTSGITETPWNPAATNGALQIITTNGTAPFNYYLIDVDSGLEIQREENSSLDSYEFTGLAVGTYHIRAIDELGCEDTTEDFYLAPLPVPTFGEPTVSEISCFNGSDGSISIEVTEGAAYRWFRNGQSFPGDDPIITNIPNGTYELETIPPGGDFSIPATIVRSNPIVLINPDPVVISTSQIIDIDCAGNANGFIVLDVSGGITYEYRLNNEDWLPLVNNQIPVSQGGIYIINVRNELECPSNTLVNVRVKEPEELQIQVDRQQDATTFLGSEGEIAITVTGGTPPYSYQWIADNGFNATSEDIQSLTAGNYMLEVRDANATNTDNNCVLIEEFEIKQPDLVEATVVDPTCFQGCDGRISLVVNGGMGDFTYAWDNGMTTAELTGLCAGAYTVTVTGLPQGPQTRTYELENPDQLIIPLPDQKTFCLDQELFMDATIPDAAIVSYAWTSTDGFSTNGNMQTLPGAGIYTVTATDDKGCIATHTIEIIQSDAEINSQFAMSSQIFVNKELIMVDISYPLPETVSWILPEESKLIKESEDEVIIMFANPGTYTVGMKTTVGNCETTTYKDVVVIARDETVDTVVNEKPSHAIESFILFPNPSTGKFTVDVELGTIGAVTVQIFSFTNNRMIASQQGEGSNTYALPFDLSAMPTGVYAIVLETPFGSALQKIVKK